jgi:hypothetical protein
VTQRLVETTVEPLKVPAGASCFVERDGARLIAKIWSRGQLKETRWLRSTGLPVGSYHVIDGTVVHRHDPRTLLAELERHQHRVRMESPEFLVVAKRLAKQLGGPLDRWENDEGAFLGYQVTPPRGGIDSKKLERVMRDFASESVILFRAGAIESSPIAICIGSRDLDLISQICTHWDRDVESLIRKLDAECGAHVEMLDHDLIVLRLDRKPKQPKPLARLVGKLARETELEFDNYDEIERSLADRRLWLWWD